LTNWIQVYKIPLLFLFSIFVIGFTDLIIVLYAFPLTEGWWEVFAIQSNIKTLYKDIYIGLPPLYIQALLFLLRINEELIFSKIIFIAIHIANFLLLCILAGNFYKLKVSIIAALISEILITVYITTYLPKDYHMFLGLLLAVYLNIFYLYFTKDKKYYLLFILGILSALIVLTKQNIGLILLISPILIIIKIEKIIGILIRILVFLFAFISTLYLYSNFYSWDWIDVYLSNNSKGSISTILLRIFTEPAIFFSSLFTILFYSIEYLFNHSIYRNKILSNIITKYTVLFILAILSLYLSKNSLISISLGITITLLTIDLLSYLKISKYQQPFVNFGPLSLVFLALIYANTMTAGINYVGSQYIFLIFMGIVLTYANNINKKIFNLISFVVIFNLATSFYNLKLNGDLYSWWGYKIGPLKDNNVDVDYSHMMALKVSEETNAILLRTKEIVDSNPSKSYYAYPDIPIIYYLFNLPIKTKYPILWFDTIPNKLTKDVVNDYLKLNPDYIFWLRPPKSVYSGHFNLRQSDSVMSSIDQLLLKGMSQGLYELVFTRPTSLGTNYSLDSSSAIEAMMYCPKCSNEKINQYVYDGRILSSDDFSPNKNDINAPIISAKVRFQNLGSYLQFCEEFSPLILDANYPIYMILKKN